MRREELRERREERVMIGKGGWTSWILLQSVNWKKKCQEDE
jgi:hypothetical protein